MEKLSEMFALVGTVDPDAYGTGDQTTDVIDMKGKKSVLFVVSVGDIASTGKVDFGVYGDTASNGSFATLITSKSITQLTQAGTDSDKQAIVEVTAQEVAEQSFRYVRGKMTLTTAGADSAVLVFASHLDYRPASEYDLASVDEIVA